MTRSVLTAAPRGATPPTAEAKRRPGGEGARRPHSPTAGPASAAAEKSRWGEIDTYRVFIEPNKSYMYM